MKKHLLFIIVVLAFLFPGSAFAAIVYCDFSCSGCDSTGAGTYGDPYQTIEKADDGLTGGDEVRVAKTGAHTALTGNLTFTNGSASVSTASDLTGELSAGDYIGKDTANEGWWKVASLDASTITLTYEYWGTSETTGAYKLTYLAMTNEQDIGVSGTSTASRLKITGGWDLTTQTRTGMTYLVGTSSAQAIDTNLQSYLEIAYFGLGYYDFGIRTYGGHDIYIHDMQCFNNTDYNLQISSTDWAIVEDIILSGGASGGLELTGTVTFCVVDNVYILSCGTGSGHWGVLTYMTSVGNSFSNIYIYNTYDEAIQCEGQFGVFEDIVIDTCIGNGVFLDGPLGQRNRFTNINISNTSTNGFYSYYGGTTWVHNATFTNIGSSNYALYATYPFAKPYFHITKDEGVEGADYITTFFGKIVKNTGDARSGSCLQFDPSDTDQPILWKVGAYKVTSVASDLTLSVYLKDDADFNGQVTLWVMTENKIVESYTLKTPTTSYVQNSIVVASGDLVDEEYIHLWVGVCGTAGNVFVDDFSVSQ